MGNGCPYKTDVGYTTEQAREEYLKQRPHLKADDIPLDLKATLKDPSKPLYFWQLYSILGKEPIHRLIKHFYERVYADTENPWFRDAFVDNRTFDHHVENQVDYWIDAMGGGKHYPGGMGRLTYHHMYSYAEEIMSAKGAKRWMVHMRGALQDDPYSEFDRDPRIRPCLVEYIKTKMKTYADRFGWDLDESDFEGL